MKTKRKSFQFKLWAYFALFAALIFIVLWLLQTVFLQGFYNSMLIHNTNRVLRSIAECGSDEEVTRAIEDNARDSSVQIYVVDSEGNLLTENDPFMVARGRDQGPRAEKQDFPGKRDDNPRSEDNERPDEPRTEDNDRPDDRNGPREFPGNRVNPGSVLPPFFTEQLANLPKDSSETFEWRSDEMYFCARRITYNESSDSILLVSTPLNAVGSAVRVIRMQLIWVTILSLILSFVLSWFLARKFSGPVNRISEKANKLGDRDYSEDYPHGFCTELDDLSSTLDRTNEKLIVSRNFQTELMANVSHDLRTPLTMIKGYAEMINDISFDDREQCRNDMQVIVKEADRLTALVNEILAYSELQTADKLEYSTDVDLSKLAFSIIESFETLSKPAGIRVEREITSGIVVDGSRSHLERALYNLMENAVRHTGERKEILVRLTADNGIATLSVTDYGNGIPAEELEHIWDRYYTSRQRKGQGVSGLGLAIVKQIVTMHGGQCKVVSEPGKGSTFSIELKVLAEN